MRLRKMRGDLSFRVLRSLLSRTHIILPEHECICMHMQVTCSDDMQMIVIY